MISDSSSTQDSNNLGLVLSAGGARAAYQVGVLKHLAEHCPSFQPNIFAGVSAGSINAAYLAQGETPREAVKKMYELWGQLQFDQVLKTNFQSLFRMVAKWGADLFLSKITKRLLLKSLLDASPLSQTLLLHIHFWKVSRAIRSGRVKGLAISTTNYHDGSLTIFYDSNQPITPWVRERRRAIRTPIRIRHIMASCSIPVLFEPVPIGDFLYGDGSLRFSFPFSPAVHLGANKIFAIGVSGVSTLIPPINGHKDSLSIGFVAGSVLNSIFLDSLDNDYENLCRINDIVGPNSPKYKPVFLMRPSGNLAALASEHLKDVPFHLRQLLSSSAKPDEMGDVLSYLMFSAGYVNTLLEMGRKDAEQRHDELEAFLKSNALDFT